jgi:hypothetical protein
MNEYTFIIFYYDMEKESRKKYTLVILSFSLQTAWINVMCFINVHPTFYSTYKVILRETKNKIS